MDLLSKSNILYINQARQENFEILKGKGFSEAFSWRYFFKNIIFVCYSSTDSFLYKKIYNNCYLIGIPFDLSLSTVKSVFNISKNYLNLFIFLNRLVKNIKIDLIRIENLLLSGLPVYLISNIKKIPYIMWLGGFERKSLFIKYHKNPLTWFLSKLIVLFEVLILRKASFVFPVTDELMEIVEKRKVQNKYLSPNFVDLSKFKNMKTNDKFETKNKINALYVGRFEEEKGIKTLLNAIKILSNENEKIIFQFIGDGSLKQWINEYITKNNLKNVKLLGIFSHEEMPKLYNHADIFILPSFTEGSPASLIEAMSCGTASIATTVGLCKTFIVNEKNGILVPPGDPNELSKAIVMLMKNKSLREKLSKNGRETIIKYTKNYSKIHKYVYEKILNQLIN